MKPTGSWMRSGRKKGLVLVAVTTVAVLAIVVLGGSVLASPAVSAQAPLATATPQEQEAAPITIQVDGQDIVLELGKNVHPETYELLRKRPSFAARSDVEWVFVENLWVPFKAERAQLPRGQQVTKPHLVEMHSPHPATSSDLYQTTGRSATLVGAGTDSASSPAAIPCAPKAAG